MKIITLFCLFFVYLFCPILLNSCNENLLPIYTQNGKFGYIDKTGKIKIKPRYDYADEFSEGLAKVEINNKVGFIDIKGKLVIKPKFDNAWSFKEGFALVTNKGESSFINKSGDLIFKYKDIVYYWSIAFSNGFTIIRKKKKANKIFIDAEGKILLKKKYDDIREFSEGYACVKYGNKWGYINTKGEEIIKPKYSFVGPFSEGLAAVCISDKCGYINKEDEIVIDVKFDGTSYFSEGMAAIRINNRLGFINKKGEIVIKPKFVKVGKFSNGLAAFELLEYPELVGFINMKGEIVINLKFFGWGQFKNGICQIRDSNDNYIYIDTAGNVVWAPKNSPILLDEEIKVDLEKVK